MALITTPPTVTEQQINLSDVTTDNASTSLHGFAPKGSANAYEFLNGNLAYKEPVPEDIRVYNLLGGGVLGETCGSSIFNLTGSGVTLASQTFRIIAVYLPQAATLTGVKWYQATQGSYTGNNENRIGLYTYSGGTLTLVASTTNDATLWSTAATNTVGNKAFSSTYAASAGLFFVGLLYSQSAQTTAPVLGNLPNLGNAAVASFDFTNSAKVAGTLASQTTLPTSQAMSGITASNGVPYVGLY